MGQRLVICVHLPSKEKDCKDEDRIFATIWYHWSAYTVSSYEETCRILDFFDTEIKNDLTNEDKVMLKLVDYLESGGGGLDSGDVDFMKKKFPNRIFSDNADRNYGIVSFSKDGMNNQIKWAEGLVDVYPTSREIYDPIWWTVCDDDEDAIEEERMTDEEKENAYKFEFDPISCTFDEAYKTLDVLIRSDVHCYKYEDYYYRLIG